MNHIVDTEFCFQLVDKYYNIIKTRTLIIMLYILFFILNVLLLNMKVSRYYHYIYI